MIDVLVVPVFVVEHVFDHDAVRSSYLLKIPNFQFRVCGDYLGIKSCLFFYFTKSSLDRVFVVVDVPTWWQPFLNLFVPVEQGGIAVNDESGCSEVSSYVGIWQCWAGRYDWYLAGIPVVLRERQDDTKSTVAIVR